MAGLKQCVRFVVAAALAASTTAWSAQVNYEAVDLPDVVAGQDLWSLKYTLQGDFAAFDGLTLLYAPGAFAQLGLSTPPDPGAFAAALAQPDAGLGADGLLTLTAVRAISGETQHFALSFIRLGTAAPGAQPFEVFDGTSFDITARGTTQALPGIPEPASALLWLAGLAGLAGLGLRRLHRLHRRALTA